MNIKLIFWFCLIIKVYNIMLRLLASLSKLVGKHVWLSTLTLTLGWGGSLTHAPDLNYQEAWIYHTFQIIMFYMQWFPLITQIMCNNVNQSLCFNNNNIFIEQPFLLFLVYFSCMIISYFSLSVSYNVVSPNYRKSYLILFPLFITVFCMTVFLVT